MIKNQLGINALAAKMFECSNQKALQEKIEYKKREKVCDLLQIFCIPCHCTMVMASFAYFSHERYSSQDRKYGMELENDQVDID